MRQAGSEVLAIPADVTQQDQVEALVNQTVEHFGRLDVLVNNVGQSTRGVLLDTTPDDFARLMEINFLSVVRCAGCGSAFDSQPRSPGEHRLAVGQIGQPLRGAYSATKFALAAYTQQLRMDLRSQGVHVMLVSPGPFVREDAGRRYADQMTGLPASAAKPGAGARIPHTKPEKLSAAILQACRRRKPELIYPGWVRVFIALIHLFPSLGDWLVRKMA